MHWRTVVPLTPPACRQPRPLGEEGRPQRPSCRHELIPYPTPRQLRAHPAPVPVARLGEVLFPGPLAAVLRRWRSAREAACLATRLSRAPATTCHYQPPGPLAPDACVLHQLTHLLEAGRWRGGPQGTTRGYQRRHLRAQQLVRRLPPQHRRHPLGRGEPSHSRSASSCSGNLRRRVSRIPWLLSKPLRRAVVLAHSCCSVSGSRCRWRCASAASEGTLTTCHT